MPAADRLRRAIGMLVAALVVGQLAVLGGWSPVPGGVDLAARGTPSARPPLTVPPTTATTEAPSTTTTAGRRGPSAPAPPTTTAPPGPPLAARPPGPTVPPTTAPPTSPPATTGPPVPAPPAQGTLPLGSVTAASPTGAACPGGASCWQATVRCPGVRDATASVAVRPADGAPRGVLVLFSGGRGEGWWEDGHQAGSGAGRPAIAAMAREGIETVQVRWAGGFSATEEGSAPGFARLACRSATAVAWVRTWRYEPLGAAAGGTPGRCGFCVTGNSGGASQAAWGLTHFGLAGLVDGLVLTSGPPHAAIDKGCLRRGGESAYWYDDGTAGGFDIAYGARRGATGPCAGHDPAGAGAWRRDGVATGGSDYAWPGTGVTFVFGDRDATVAPAHGADLAGRLAAGGTPVTVREVRGMGHEVVASDAGRSALVAAVLDRA